jgi:hypothetical protein
MFKKLLKGRHDRKAAGDLDPSPPLLAYQPQQQQQQYQQQGYGAASSQVYSPMPVDYNMSPPTAPPPARDQTFAAVEYTQSPPTMLQQPPVLMGPAVEYDQSAPST